MEMSFHLEFKARPVAFLSSLALLYEPLAGLADIVEVFGAHNLLIGLLVELTNE